MNCSNQSIGKLGEKIASDYLQKKNYVIIDTHVTCRYGEIDIVAKKNNKFIFIEVKTRVGIKKGQPYEAVNRHKIHVLHRAIQYYLLKNKIKGYKLSIHVISIVLNNDLTINNLKHYEDVSYD